MDELQDGVEVQECEDDDDDIYGDLEGEIWGPAAKKAKTDNVVNDEQYQALLKENQELKTLVKKLKLENRHYSENMSSLFLTAKNEVDKKNFIIKNLTEKLKKISRVALSKQEAEDVLKNCHEALLESQEFITLEEISKRLKKVPEYTAKRRRKHVKFGNMSMYFFTEQSNIEREETVVIPQNKRVDKQAEDEKSASETTSTDQSSTGTSQNSEPVEPEKRDCDNASRLRPNGSSISGSSDRSRKSSCDTSMLEGQGQAGEKPPTRKEKDNAKDANNRDNLRRSERSSHHKRPHSPSTTERHPTTNRRDEIARSKDIDSSRPVDQHSRDRRDKDHRSGGDDHRSSRRITRRSTNESKYHDSKRQKNHRSRSR